MKQSIWDGCLGNRDSSAPKDEQSDRGQDLGTFTKDQSNSERFGIAWRGPPPTIELLSEIPLEESGAAEYYRELLDQAPVGLLVLDERGNIREANQAAAQCLGLDREQLPGKPFDHFISSRNKGALCDHLEQTATLGRIECLEAELVNGRNVLLQFRVLSSMGDAQGHVIALVEAAGLRGERDSQHFPQEALTNSGAMLKAVIDQMPTGVCLFEVPSGRLLMRNREAGRIMRRSPSAGSEDEAVEEHLEPGAGVTFEAATRSCLIRAILHGETVRKEEVECRGADGSLSYLAINAAPVSDAEGRTLAVVCTTSDLSTEKQIRRELEMQQRELESLVVKRTEELKAQAVKLEERNVALKVLAENQSREKEELEEAIILNIQRMAIPLIDRIRRQSDNAGRLELLEALEAGLKDITSGFSSRLLSACYNLTHRELEVAEMVKRGKTTDEIAELLCIASSSVMFHRNNIRKKLGLTGRRQRLNNYLRAIE